MCLPASTCPLTILPCPPDSKDDELRCVCENDKGTCVNGTCLGYKCFYSWVNGNEERGCFSEKNFREQCSASFDGFFVHCCKETLCNALTTPPPNISQYPYTFIYNIVMSTHPLIFQIPLGPISQSGALFEFLCTKGKRHFPFRSNWFAHVVS